MSIFAKHLNSVAVPHHKNTASIASVKVPVVDVVTIQMGQHIGAPAKPLVKKGDKVKVGQKIADTDAFVSAPIHSSVSGEVVKISTVRNAMGMMDEAVEIKTDGLQEISEEVKKPEVKDFESFIAAVRASGAVGLGGAAFPTHIKFNPKNIDEVDTIIINAAECEPFITADHRLMLEDPVDILDGIEITMRYMGIKRAIIGIESNKPNAIEVLNSEISKRKLDGVSIKVLQSRYPQGAERVLAYEATGRKLDAGVLPADIGLIITNVATIAFIGQYMRNGIPLINKRLTVDGDAVNTPQNVIVAIGTPIKDLIAACGGYKKHPKKILMGGPMMGRAIFSDELPIIKNNNAILAFADEDKFTMPETPCISCGKCHQACPFDLLPAAYYKAYKSRDVDTLNKLMINQCMECGSCSYVCPARKPLGFTNKLCKILVKEASK